MDIEQEVRQVAERVDERTRAKLFEYLVLRERLIALTGVENPSEATLTDILPIEDYTQRKLAGATAARMRRLIRETFPNLTE